MTGFFKALQKAFCEHRQTERRLVANGSGYVMSEVCVKCGEVVNSGADSASTGNASWPGKGSRGTFETGRYAVSPPDFVCRPDETLKGGGIENGANKSKPFGSVASRV